MVADSEQSLRIQLAWTMGNIKATLGRRLRP